MSCVIIYNIMSNKGEIKFMSKSQVMERQQKSEIEQSTRHFSEKNKQTKNNKFIIWIIVSIVLLVLFVFSIIFAMIN